MNTLIEKLKKVSRKPVEVKIDDHISVHVKLLSIAEFEAVQAKLSTESNSLIPLIEVFMETVVNDDGTPVFTSRGKERKEEIEEVRSVMDLKQLKTFVMKLVASQGVSQEDSFRQQST